MSLSIQLGLYAVLIGSLAIGVLVRPALAITAVACVFGLKQWGQLTVPWLAQHSTFTNVATGCMVLAALAVQTFRGECVPCRLRAINWMVLGLFGYAFLSVLWTPRPDLAMSMVWEHEYPYILTFVLLAPLVVKDLDGLRSSLLALAVVGGVLMAVLLIFGDWGVRGLVLHGNFRERETNPLALAGLAGSVAAAAMFVRARSWKWLGWPLRVAIVVVSLLVIVRSGSRGQLIAALGALLLMLPVAFRVTRMRGLAGILVAVAILALALGYAATEYMQANEARWDESLARHDAAGRWKMATHLLGVWANSGTGVVLGLGNSAAYDLTILGFYPHIVPLEILAEEGLVGAVLYLCILWMALSGLRRGWRLSRHKPEVSGLLAAVGASFVFMLLISFKEGNMVGSIYLFMYAILLARMPELARAAERGAVAPQPARERAIAVDSARGTVST
jgi:O-antigen ligase